MGHEMMKDTTAAVQQFQEIFMDDVRRQDRAQWRAFVSRKLFWTRSMRKILYRRCMNICGSRT